MIFPVIDWIALGWFLAMWAGYHRFAEYWSLSHPSLLRQMNHYRREWILRLTHRENRIADVALMANLSSSATFFASTTIIIIGGLFAMLGGTAKVVEIVSEIPFSVRASESVWNVKIILLICVFVFAFFRFTWSLRQFNFCAIMIGAAQSAACYNAGDEAARIGYADRTGELVALAGETFNDGLRGYYFAIAAMTWFLQPLAFMLATTLVVIILYYREFRSTALHALIGNHR